MDVPQPLNIEDTEAFKAVRNPDLAIRSPGRQGWQQLLNWKRELLSAYDRGRHYARGHEVETYHGIVAEAHLRSWLSEFLPKRFGVTAGYIISQCAPPNEKTPAFDVIIYDQLESPVLWAEDHPDISPRGKMRAIPAEYVRAVVEVKASLNTTNASKAVDHLFDLSPLLGVDDPDVMQRCCLPLGFTCWTVFFDLREEDQRNFCALDHLARANALRGFTGGFVLRGEGLDEVVSGELSWAKSNVSLNSLPSAENLLSGTCFSEYLPISNGWFAQCSLSWSRVYFATWPFLLLQMLNSTDATPTKQNWYGFPPVP